jgi:chitinase
MRQGQAGGSLRSYCETSDLDYIPLGFINFFPAQGNGWPGSNFASSCGSEVYIGSPGYHGVDNQDDNKLLSHCPGLAQDIQYCQSKGKKMLLSLGGASSTYSLTGRADGEGFADFLWSAFGPADDSWTGPRPFDPLPGTEGEGTPTVVDGFDFDIEHPDTGKNRAFKCKMLAAKFHRQLPRIYRHDQQASQPLP